MNIVQKAVRWAFSKAVGFPRWGLTDPWPGGYSSIGGYSSEPMQLAVVYGCARIRSQAIASVPFNIYREKKSGTREKDTENALYEIIHSTANANDTSYDFRENLEFDFCMAGNNYAEIASLGSRVTALNRLIAARMRPRRDPFKGLLYEYSYDTGKQETFPPEKILHIRNFSLDGICGLTPIRRYVFEHALLAQSYGRNAFKNSSRPGGYLASEQKRPAADGTTDKMSTDWNKIHEGPENSNKTAVLWNGLKYVPVTGIAPDDMQYIETRKLSAAEIAMPIYGVPLQLLGAVDTPTYASAEQFAMDFLRYTVRPHCVKYEQVFNKRLFSKQPGVFCEFDLDGFQRGDSASQASYFSQLTQNGIMTRNEARRKLNLPEVKGGDELTVQSNLIDLDKLASVTNRAAAPPAL